MSGQASDLRAAGTRFPDHATVYDAIVLGLGGVGSAALYHLARRGATVLGLDRFAIGHDRGSSHGATRIIRQAYFEHPDYVPLLLRAYELWAELERASGVRLFHQCGLLQVGPSDGEVAPGVLRSARMHQLEVESLSSREVSQRFPGFRAPDEMIAVFEPRAGYLFVESCVTAHVAEAIKAGAVVQTGVAVKSWHSRGRELVVDTDAGVFRCRSLAIAAGPWAAEFLAEAGVSVRVLRKPLHWFPCLDDRHDAEQGCPTFLYETPQGVYYGFPRIDERGLKAARHDGGDWVADPLNIDRRVDQAELSHVQRFVAECLPGVAATAAAHAVCMYTMSPDGHFLVDRHPGESNVVFAAGLSGHGFKFTSVLGEMLAEHCLHGGGRSFPPLFRLDRFDKAGP